MDGSFRVPELFCFAEMSCVHPNAHIPQFLLGLSPTHTISSRCTYVSGRIELHGKHS